MGAHDAGQTTDPCASGCHLVRQTNQPRQGARHLHNGDLVLAPKASGPRRRTDEIQDLVGNLRGKDERDPCPHRNQERTHSFESNSAPTAAALRCAPVERCEFWPQTAGSIRRCQRILTHDQLVKPAVQGDSQPGSRCLAGARQCLDGRRDMRRATTPQKLIQVG